MNENLFPKKLIELRKSRNLSQKQVAEAIKLSNAMYCRIESGLRLMKSDQIDLVADLYKIEAKELHSLSLADKINSEVKDYPNEVINMAVKALNKDV